MRFFFLALFLITLSIVPLHAAEPNAAEKGKYKPKELTYEKLSRTSLSQLFWRMGVYNVDNDIDVDNFILLNRCDLYQESYRDDFLWHTIREEAKESLKKNAKKFPNRLKIVQPIALGRYDVRSSSFPLSRAIQTSRFEVIAEEEWACKKFFKRNLVWKYPHRAIVTFSNPLIIESFDSDPEAAQLYNELYKHVDIHRARPAYIVLSFKVFEASITEKGKKFTSNLPAKLSAVIEKIDFYGDQDLTIHLASLDYRKGNRKRVLGQ